MKKHAILCAAFLGLLASTGSALAQAPDVLLPGNLKTMGMAAPDEKFAFLESSQPLNIFYPGDRVDLSVKVAPDATSTPGTKFVRLSVVEIGTRTNGFLGGQSAMSPPPATEVYSHEARTLDVPLQPVAGQLAIYNVPIPARYGCYAISIAPDGKNPQFLCTVLRAMKPAPGATSETPIQGEAGQVLGGSSTPDEMRRTIMGFGRMGVKVARVEETGMGGLQADGTQDWKAMDAKYKMFEDAGIKLIVTVGAHPEWTMPLGHPTPSIGDFKDYTADPKYYPLLGKWTEAFCRRYWKGGNGALYTIEHYNEAWEPIGISGWANNSAAYRAMLREISMGAKRVDPRIRIAAACSIMNTEDKLLTGDDRAETAKLIDTFTDHYVGPSDCYGPMVARFYGKDSYETETWGAATEVLIPQFVCSFLGSGQTRVAPWATNMVLFKTPGAKGEYAMPNPTALASNVADVLIGQRHFKRTLFQNHLPWAFQFGEDKDATVILLGRLTNRLSFFGPADPRSIVWSQFSGQPGGTMTVDNADGALQVRNLEGNPVFVGQKSFTIPLDMTAYYVTSRGGASLIQKRLAAAKFAGARPVEIIARDFQTPVGAPGAALSVTLHNLLTTPLHGSLTPSAAGITFKSAALPVALAPGETRDFRFPINAATANPANAYPFTFNFKSDGGDATLAETMSVVMAKHGAKKMDGDLSDWGNDLGVVVNAQTEQANGTERAWLPFAEWKDKQPNGSFAEVKTAWDDNFFYVGARVNSLSSLPHTALANWDESQFFWGAADDARMERLRPFEKFVVAQQRDDNEKAAFEKLKTDADYPAYQAFLTANPDYTPDYLKGARAYFDAKTRNPKASFGDAPNVYKKNFGDDAPWAGDTFQFAIDAIPGYAGKDVVTDFDRVPEGFHALPDTDFEYAAYATPGGAELWRLLAPGVPRGHHFPRQARSKIDQGVVPGGKCVVKRTGTITTYEVAIPWSELKGWHPQAGSNFGFTFRVNNASGAPVVYGLDKSATKVNSLTMHPYWQPGSSAGVRWMLGG